eukprot:jgi/Ulvmu1/11569/UM079_0012.1
MVSNMMSLQAERRRFGKAPVSCAGPTHAVSDDSWRSSQGSMSSCKHASHDRMPCRMVPSLLTPSNCCTPYRNTQKATAPHRKLLEGPHMAVSRPNILARSAVGVVYRTFSPKKCLSPGPKVQRSRVADCVQNKQSEQLRLKFNSSLCRGAANFRPTLALGRSSTPSVKLSSGRAKQPPVDNICNRGHVAQLPKSQPATQAWHPLHRLAFSKAGTRERHRGQLPLMPASAECPCKALPTGHRVDAVFSCLGSQARFLPPHELSALLIHGQPHEQNQACEHMVAPEVRGRVVACCRNTSGVIPSRDGVAHASPVDIGKSEAMIVNEDWGCKHEAMILDNSGEKLGMTVLIAMHEAEGTDDSVLPSCPKSEEVEHKMRVAKQCHLSRISDTLDGHGSPQVYSSSRHDHFPSSRMSEDRTHMEHSNDLVPAHSAMGTCSSPLQCSGLVESECILGLHSGGAFARQHPDDESDNLSSITGSMTSSSDENCSTPIVDWCERTESDAIVANYQTMPAAMCALAAVPPIGSHPLLLNNRTSVSPDICGPTTEHAQACHICPQSELSAPSVTSERDVGSMDTGGEDWAESGINSIWQGSPRVPDENDLVENGRRVLGKRYVVEKVVGEGAYGIVMKCHLLHYPSRHVAVKVFKIAESDSDAEDVKRTARREAALLKKLRHKNITALLDTFLIQDKLCICMEFSPRTLLELLEDTNDGNGLEPDLVRQIVFQILCAITFLHSQVRLFRISGLSRTPARQNYMYM